MNIEDAANNRLRGYELGVYQLPTTMFPPTVDASTYILSKQKHTNLVHIHRTNLIISRSRRRAPLPIFSTSATSSRASTPPPGLLLLHRAGTPPAFGAPTASSRPPSRRPGSPPWAGTPTHRGPASAGRGPCPATGPTSTRATAPAATSSAARGAGAPSWGSAPAPTAPATAMSPILNKTDIPPIKWVLELGIVEFTDRTVHILCVFKLYNTDHAIPVAHDIGVGGADHFTEVVFEVLPGSRAREAFDNDSVAGVGGAEVAGRAAVATTSSTVISATSVPVPSVASVPVRVALGELHTEPATVKVVAIATTDRIFSIPATF